MKKRLFSFGVYKEVFRRLMGIGIAFAALMLLLGMIRVFSLNPDVAVHESGTLVSETVYLVEPSEFMPLLLAPLYIFGIVTVSRAFSFLRKRPSTDFYFSMPVSRAVYYISASLAIATWMFAIAVAGCLGVCVSSLIMGALFNYALLLPMLLTILSSCALIISVSLISASITGTPLMYLLGVIIILFLPRMIFSLIGDILNTGAILLGDASELSVLFDYSYNIPATFPYWLLLGGLNANDYYINIAASVYTLVHAAILWFIGMLLYKKRKAEAADTPAATAFHQAFFRCACGLPILVLLSYMLFKTVYNPVYYGSAVIMLAVSLVMFIGYELLTSRSIKKLVKALPTYGICIVIAVIMSLTLTALQNFDAETELTADDISWFSIRSEDNYSTSSYLTLSLEEIRFTDDELKAYIAEGINNDNTNFIASRPTYDMTATVQLKNGRRFTTGVYFEFDTAYEFMNLLSENEDYSELTSYRPEISDVSAALIDERLTSEQQQAVLESFIKECGTLPDDEIASINIHGMDFGLFDNSSNCVIFATGSGNYLITGGEILSGDIHVEPDQPLVGVLVKPYVRILSIYGTHGYDYCIQNYCLDDTFSETSALYMQFIKEWHEKEYYSDDYIKRISFTQVLDILTEDPELVDFSIDLDLRAFAGAEWYDSTYDLYLDSYRSDEEIGKPNPEYAVGRLNPEYAEILSRAEFSTDPSDYIRININMFVDGVGSYYMPEAYIKLSEADLERLIELIKEDSKAMAGID